MIWIIRAVEMLPQLPAKKKAVLDSSIFGICGLLFYHPWPYLEEWHPSIFSFTKLENPHLLKCGSD